MANDVSDGIGRFQYFAAICSAENQVTLGTRGRRESQNLRRVFCFISREIPRTASSSPHLGIFRIRESLTVWDFRASKIHQKSYRSIAVRGSLSLILSLSAQRSMVVRFSDVNTSRGHNRRAIGTRDIRVEFD